MKKSISKFFTGVVTVILACTLLTCTVFAETVTEAATEAGQEGLFSGENGKNNIIALIVVIIVLAVWSMRNQKMRKKAQEEESEEQKAAKAERERVLREEQNSFAKARKLMEKNAVAAEEVATDGLTADESNTENINE